MEKKIVKRMVTAKVEQDVEVYVTSDGKEYVNEFEAKGHQERLDRAAKFKQIPSREFPFELSIDRKWYFLNSIEDLYILEDYIAGKYLKQINYTHETVSFPNWYLVERDEDSHRIYLYLSDINEVREHLKTALATLDEISKM